MLLVRSVLAVLAIAITATTATAAPRTITVTTAALGDTTVVAPATEPDAFVILISDGVGLTGAVHTRARSLAGKGAAVALIDLPQFIARKDAEDTTGCHAVFGDLEAMARVAERHLGMKTWRRPVIVGLGGDGGAFAYLTLAQAPPNSAAGAVSLGFSPVVASERPLCPGAPSAPLPGGGFAISPMTDLPGPWTLITSAPDAKTAAFLTGRATGVTASGDDAWRAAENAALSIEAGRTDPLSDLPITALPAQDPAALAVFISGDGGWRDLDKTIGEWLSAHGIAVVGLDALHYFWSTRQPDEIAHDIERIVAHYSVEWDTDKVALLGYSFGADVMPLVWPRLSATTKDETVLIGLLGLARTATLEVTVAGWLGLTAHDAIGLDEPLAGLPTAKVLCIYGASEVSSDATGCTFASLAGATLVERPGGHHFDGKYDLLAQMIHDRIENAVSTANAPDAATAEGATPK